MSRQFDAKQHALQCRTKSDGVELFLSFLDISEDDFQAEEGMSAEEYIYGKDEHIARDKMSENEIIECLLDGKPFVFDPATYFCHADDGGAPEHGIKYVPAAPQDAPVAEIVSAHGDPEAFGERELVARVDIQKFPYGTKLYAALSTPTSQP